MKLTLLTADTLRWVFRQKALKRWGLKSTVVAALLCGGGLVMASNQAQDNRVQSVQLSFAGEFAGKTFDCHSQFTAVGSSGSTVTVSEFKVFVSRIRMLDAAGDEFVVTLDDDGLWQQQDVALLDFEDGRGNCVNGTSPTNTTIRGTVAAGEYSGVAFDIGVPFEKNHGDPTLAASPLNLTSMFWNWRGGYRFMRVDMAVVNPANKAKKGKHEGKHESKHAGKHAGHSGGRGWSLHVGSTGCIASSPTSAPSSCVSPNRVSVNFGEFDARVNSLVIDPANVIQQADITSNTPQTAPGCMSSPDDPECMSIFSLLGLQGDTTEQALVRVR